jgi:hypothetical protein
MKVRGPVLTLVAVLALTLAGTANAARLSASDRRAINHTLDMFVNYAVKRHQVIKAYDFVTPEMRGTRKQWSSGQLPVYPFPARGTKFHGWTVQEVSRNEVGFQLILMPVKGSKQGSIAFLGSVRRIHGRWLVDDFNPGAIFAPEGSQAHVIGTQDFMPGQQIDSGGSRVNVGRVSGNYAFIPFLVFGLIILVLALSAVVAVIRHKRYVSAHGGPLPPLSVRLKGRGSRRSA